MKRIPTPPSSPQHPVALVALPTKQDPVVCAKFLVAFFSDVITSLAPTPVRSGHVSSDQMSQRSQVSRDCSLQLPGVGAKDATTSKKQRV